jgi:hypothetical protein
MRNAEARAVREVRPDRVAAMVEIDHHFVHAVAGQHAHVVLENRPAADGDHGFGNVVSQRSQTRPFAGGQNESLHVERSSQTRRALPSPEGTAHHQA